MQRWSLSAALAITVMSGCTNAATPQAGQPQPIAYDPAKSMARNCMEDRGIDYPAYARTIDIVTRSGDLARARAYYGAVRAEVERVLVARNPAALAEARPLLEPFFSDKALRKQAVCDFTRYSRNPPMIEAWEAWVSDTRLRGVHERIVSDAAPGAMPSSSSSSRRALLLRVWNATGKIDLASTKRQSAQRVVAEVEARLDPLKTGHVLTAESLVPPVETEQAGVDVRLAHRLSGVADREIASFLAWAESGPGQAYYRALTATYTGSHWDWLRLLGEQTRTRIAPKVISFGGDDMATQLAGIGKSLETVDTIYTKYPLRDRLANLALRDRDNPRIKALLARLEVEVVEGPEDMRRPRDSRLLRDSDLASDASNFDRYRNAEVAIERALAAAPDDADLHAMAGFVQFLKLDDEGAATHYAQARRVDAANPMLALFEGDLAYARKQYPKAEKLYRAAIAAAGDRQLTRHRAVMHLGLALDAMGRSKEFDAITRLQLPLMQDAWQMRHDHAESMLDRGAKSDEVAALISPIPKDWQPDLMAQLRERLSVQRIIETAPPARTELAKTAFAKSYDSSRIAVAACRSREPSVFTVVRTAMSGRANEEDMAKAMFGCAIQYRRPDALAVVLPSIKDVNLPINSLWQDPAVCGAAARNDDRSLALLIKAGADTQVRCRNGKNPREMLSAAVARGDVEAKAALAALDGGTARR